MSQPSQSQNLPELCWGKFNESSEPRFHPLVDHCLDVALAFLALIRTPQLLRSLQKTSRTDLNSEIQLNRLAVLAYLHDFGKCNKGFQAKAYPTLHKTAGHVFEAAALLWEDVLYLQWPPNWRNLLMRMQDWFDCKDESLFEMLLATLSHHGKPLSKNDYLSNNSSSLHQWWQAEEHYDPMNALDKLAYYAFHYFPSAFAVSSSPPLSAAPDFQQRFAGLVMLADWIASDTRFFPYRESLEEDRFSLATQAADRALSAIGIASSPLRKSRVFATIFGFEPNLLQKTLNSEISTDESSHLLLIESDTGSGKTEAALSWYLRLYCARQVDGLYFALPTRVAAREAYQRVLASVNNAFAEDERPSPVLLAAPGYVQADGIPYILPDPQGRLWPDSPADAQHERLWAAERPKRFLAAPVSVGTIDQALLSVLAVKHSMLRSVCLDRHLLVVDEVHASDIYMRRLLRELLQGHIARGGYAILLSATLGDSACSSFFSRPPLTLTEAIARPYPSITTLNHEIPVVSSNRNKPVSIEILQSLEDAPLLPQLAEALSLGARVLVICNTVSRANALLRAVEASGNIDPSCIFRVADQACPHHGRFAVEDRSLMDGAVSSQLGKSSSSGSLLLIGTQTLEQSLDIDADLLITDLCPIDVLLQRIGRLHRHVRADRPFAFNHAKVIIRVPESSDLSVFIQPDGRCIGPAGIGFVYEDARILQLTLAALQNSPRIEIPRDNRRLVELATHPESLFTLSKDKWRSHTSYLEGMTMTKEHAATRNTIAKKPFGELQFLAPEERVATRLGLNDRVISFNTAMTSPFGSRLKALTLPAHMLPPEALIPDCVHAEQILGGFAFEIGSRSYSYTRFGLEKRNV